MTDLFANVISLQSFYDATGSLADLDALEAAEREYARAVADVSAEWAALPAGAVKDSAEVNANETEGLDAQDRLGWLRVAVRTYYLNTSR